MLCIVDSYKWFRHTLLERDLPVNTEQLYNICTIVGPTLYKMLYTCFTFTGNGLEIAWYPTLVSVLQCSAKCGKGHKERAVKCRFPNGIILADSECDATVQPTERLTCIVRPCPKTTLINSIIATPTLSPDRRYNSPSTESWTIRPTQWRTGGWTTVS